MVERLETSFKAQQTLIAELEWGVEQQRRFTADASHELRTPLTAIKANTSLFLSGGWNTHESVPLMEDIDHAANAMAHLVDDLLLLARADEGQLGHHREIVFLHNVIESALTLATSGKSDVPTLNIECLPSLSMSANEGEFKRLIVNLIVNAVAYTPSDGRITMSAERENNFVRVRVADTGIGVASQHLAHLGERFFRVESARSRPAGGTGLGLSICQSIAASHGGSIRFESTVGVGTTVTVLLPDTSEGDQKAVTG